MMTASVLNLQISAKVTAALVLCLLPGFASPVCAAQQQAELTHPPGFRAVVFHPGVGQGTRHIAQCENGFLYANTAEGIAVLNDKDGDGASDEVRRFGSFSGTGVRCQGDKLFVSSNQQVFRYRLDPQSGMPKGEPEMAAVFPAQRQHEAKSLALDGKGGLYVNVGAPSNSCQVHDRSAGSPGIQPCPLLEQHGGIWRAAADGAGQRQGSGAMRYATGVRNAVALSWNPIAGRLFLVMHGRDQLYPLFDEHYSAKDNAELPAEELHSVPEGADLGWPYTYYDGRTGKRMIAPEYGGDGKRQAAPGKYREPLKVYPAHWAPNDLLFYTGRHFPKRYYGGAFIAFHGSWNRAPLPQQGYKVVFQPFDGEQPSGEFEVFADGFAGSELRRAAGQARYRPMGLAQGLDGSLFISDSRRGRIWNIRYKAEGEKNKPPAQVKNLPPG